MTHLPTAPNARMRIFQRGWLILPALLCAFLTTEAQAQETGTITGRVLNARTGRFVNNAEVHIVGTQYRELTNQFGEYEIYDLAPGEYTMEAIFTGLEPQYSKATVVAGETTVQDFTFMRRRGEEQQTSAAREDGEEPVFELSEFVVNANDFQGMQELAIQEERVSVNLKHVVAADAYGAVAQGNIGEFVKFIPGVDVGYGGAYSSGASATSISIRGYGAEQTAVTIDGIPIANAQPGSLTEAVGLDMLSINNASRVEVIKVPTPDQPGASISGTVNLISKTAFEYPEPKLSYRVYFTINSENTDFFKKTPGPTNKPTYKTLPGVDLSYALPLNDKIGFTFSLASSNQFSENHRIKPSWRTKRNTEIGEWVGEDGTVISPVYADATRPVLDNFSISDNPFFEYRISGSVKMDYRPFEGLLITANYQYSTVESEQGDRLAEMNAAGNFALESYGPDYHIGQDGEGNSQLIVRSLDKDGETHSGYLKAQYIKGPWDIRAHVSMSTSDGNLISGENGHFSEIELGMGGIHKSYFRDIVNSIPQSIEYYDEDGNLLDPHSLDYYSIANYDPNDPQASTLSVRAGETRSKDEITTYKFDIKRDLDFLPFDWMNASIKAGFYREEKDKSKAGLGSNYKYQYLGESGVVLDLADFRDDNYLGVDPGFGFDPYEWPSTYKLYDFFLDNPSAFSNDHDIPRFNSDSDPGVEEISVAANNYNEYVNTNYSITTIETSWYWQLETKFFDNRLQIVGGVRQSERERRGRAKYTDPDWNLLRTGEDANGDGFLDVFPSNDPGGFPVINDTMFTSIANYWEGRGATYADGTPFRAGFAYDGTPMATRKIGPVAEVYYYPEDTIGVNNQGYIVNGTLTSAQLATQANYPVNERAVSQPSPVISGSFDVTDKIVVRLSWSQSHAKENIEDTILRDIRFDLNSTPPTIRINNPNLTPWTANSYDIGVTYYTDTGGKISVSYFIKQEEDFHEDVFYEITDENYDTLLPQFGLPPDPIYADDDWIIQTQRNGEGTGESSGYELEVSQTLGFLGDWAKSFYVYASWSSKSRRQTIPTGGTDPVGQSSDDLASGGINFSYKRFSARLNATWRSEQISQGQTVNVLIDPTQPDTEDNRNVVSAYVLRPAETKVDLNLSYRISDRYSIDLTARNITNTKQETFFESVDDTYPAYAALREQKQFGVSYTIGFSGSF